MPRSARPDPRLPSLPRAWYEDSPLNALTKAFVVVVTILSVALVALVVPFAATVPKYKEAFEAMKADRDAQAQKASDDFLAAIQEKAAIGEQLTDKENRIKAKTVQIGELEKDISGHLARIAQLETTLARTSQALAIATSTSQTKDARITEMSDLIQKQIGNLGELQAQMADLSQRMMTVNAENRRLSTNFLRIQEENRALVQQLTETQAKLDVAIEKLAGFGVGGDTLNDVVPTPNIEGAVVSVSQISDDLTLVQVNVGTRDKVREGMEFTVSRGDQFVGTIKITTVDTAGAVGQITLGGGVKQGDAIKGGGR